MPPPSNRRQIYSTPSLFWNRKYEIGMECFNILFLSFSEYLTRHFSIKKKGECKTKVSRHINNKRLGLRQMTHTRILLYTMKHLNYYFVNFVTRTQETPVAWQNKITLVISQSFVSNKNRRQRLEGNHKFSRYLLQRQKRPFYNTGGDEKNRNHAMLQTRVQIPPVGGSIFFYRKLET